MTIDGARDADYAEWRAAMLKWQQDCERHISLRDTFAAAALTGLVSRPQWMPDECVPEAYRLADAMLRERATISVGASGAAPVAGRKSVAAHGACARSCSQPFDSAPITQPAPPRVETDEFSSGSRSGQINRTPERESPRRECGESLLRDVPQQDNCRAAGGPEPSFSEAEIDALEFVVEEGRIASIHDYGILRSLLIRLRQEWEFRDSPEPIAGCDIDRLKPVKEAAFDRSEPIRIDLSQPCMVDPPSGWKWGFPRRYDPAEDGPMKEWLIRNGYPKHLADRGLTCTFTLCDKETTDK